MNFVLVPLHTGKLETKSYSDNTTFYVYAAFFNVLLTYGMETAFFRFFSKSEEKGKVFSTALISLTVTAILFLIGVFLFNEQLADLVNLKQSYFNLLIGVLVLDTIVVIPFAYLRATGRPIKFTAIKLSNIVIYVLLNFFFLWAIPKFGINYPNYDSNDLVKYIFIANLAASVVTFLLLTPYFFKTKLQFSKSIFKQLLNYGLPIMVAGLAYVINENFDKWLLPDVLGKEINGAYSGCYKIAVFMTIFIQAFRLGAEPFFFNHAKEKNAKETYARIMKYFVIFGSAMLVFIIAYLDVFKSLIVRDESYCYGMYLSIVGAIITIVFNVVMIEKIGFIASAWATLIAYGTMMVISYYLGQKHYAVPYNLKSILSYLVLAVALSVVALNTNTNYYLNTGLVLLFLGLVFVIERRELKQLLKR